MAVSPPPSVTLTVRGPLDRSDLPGLFARTCALLEGMGAGVLRCQVAGLRADSVSVDALARLALAARRHGCSVQLCGASPELSALVSFIGLAEVLRE